MTTTLSRTTPATSPVRNRKPRRTGRALLYYVPAVAIALLFLFPMVWTTLASFKTPTEANQSPPTYLPHHVSLGNYRDLYSYGIGVWGYLKNSLIVALMTVVMTVLASVTGGYAFARFRFPAKGAAFLLVLAILMVPYPTILIALYFLLGEVGLQNSLVGLSFVLLVFQLPFATYMMRNSFEAFPRELEEAALVDGAGTMGVLLRIVLPAVTPGIVTVALFAFLASWNEFLAPLIFLNDSSKFTLPVMLVNVSTGAFGSTNFGALQSGVVIAMLPCILLFLALQRFYVSGLVAGSLKD